MLDKRVADIYRELCGNGNLELLKVLYFHKDETIRVTPTYLDNHAIKAAIKYNHLHIIKYILSSEELSEYGYADAHTNNDYPFIFATIGKKREIIEYLLLDYQINLTPKIQELINEYDWVKEILEKRNLKEKLFTELEKSKSQKTKEKI